MPAAVTFVPDRGIRLFMTTDAVGGVMTYALDLARGLAAQRVATTLAVLGPPPGAGAMAAARGIPGCEMIDTGLPLDWLADAESEIVDASAAVAELAHRTAADVVQLNSPALAIRPFRQPLVGVCHSCLATWWSAVRGGMQDEDMLWRTRLLARGYAACDVLVAPSASFAAATRQHYGCQPLVIPNGRAQPSCSNVERERFVLTAGRLWDDAKNVTALDEAACLIDAPLWAAGPLVGPEGSAARLHHARSLGSLDATSLRAWMARAPVFASMAVYEPFGLTVLEAAQAGCALVLSDIASFRELWGGVATLVPLGQPRRLAETLQHLLDTPDLAAERGAAARRHSQRYGVEKMAASMHALYRGVLQPAACRPAQVA